MDGKSHKNVVLKRVYKIFEVHISFWSLIFLRYRFIIILSKVIIVFANTKDVKYAVCDGGMED